MDTSASGSDAMTQQRDGGLLERAQGMLLGAAVGDALGWPQEQRSGILGGQKARQVQPTMAFRAWTRLAGSRFTANYEDTVHPGEYSDDTQLLLATARAVLRGDKWLTWLQEVELPLWPVYQRGGGRAVLAASRAWEKAVPPWDAQKNKVRTYFNAGANGVAMRIAPHVLATARDSDTSNLVARVVRDGITTHGHTRALLGAVVYALALRSTFHSREAMEYGGLLNFLESNPEWTTPDIPFSVLPTEWTLKFEEYNEKSFPESWHQTAVEMRQLLQVCHSSLDRAALADDERTLAEIGCFDRKWNGAGTVTAAAAIYLASRSSVQPSMGLLRAAYLRGADTDTVASMTAGLLGALHGPQWLDPLLGGLQDREYIESVSSALLHSDALPEPCVSDTTQVESPRDWLKQLVSSCTASAFADMRPVARVTTERITTRRNTSLSRFRIALNDGQSLVIDVGGDVPTAKSPDFPSGTKSDQVGLSTSSQVTRVGLPVLDLSRTRRFYEEILGVPVSTTVNGFYVSPWLAFLQSDQGSPATHACTARITVSTEDTAHAMRMVQKYGVPLAPKGPRDRPDSLRVYDPDGHEVLVWPARGESKRAD